MSKALFQRSINDAFTHMGEEARYRPAAGGSSKIRIVPMVDISPRSTSVGLIVQDEANFHVRSADVAKPAIGDEIDYDGRTFRVRSAPRLGVAGNVWYLDAPPVSV